MFVGRDRSGTPRYAHVRGTADPFRQDIAGSDKSYPFHYEGNGNQLFVFEAPIDLLSFICLYPQDWQTRSYLALGGVSGKALDRFLSERKDTRKVFLCLDSDTAGSEACTRLAQSIPGEIAVIRLVPARKDWNDVLRQQGDIPSRKFIAETITLMLPPCLVPSYRHRPMMNSHRAFFIYRRILNEQYRNQHRHLPDCQKADRQDNLYRPCAFQPDRKRDNGGQNQASAP